LDYPSALGHEDQFRLSKQSGCCRFDQGIFAVMRGNGRDAPKAVVAAAAAQLPASARSAIRRARSLTRRPLIAQGRQAVLAHFGGPAMLSRVAV